MRKAWTSLVASIILLCSAPACQSGAQNWTVGQPRRFDGTLSILTYNVKGGPWPVALNRSDSLYAIGQRLRRMRAGGRNPQVVVLQEAFSTDAREIARHAGYRYVVAGPSTADRTPAPAVGQDASFMASGHWWLGEMKARALNSGLLVLSDYPISNVRRIAFPDFACAGLDCLANKGAVLVTLHVPGAQTPVDVLTTHLNSRYHSLVDDERSLYAYRRQVDILARFISQNRSPDRPLIAAGDFNVGHASDRGAALFASLPVWNFGLPVDHALRIVAAAHQGLPSLQPLIHHNADFVFFAPGKKERLAVATLSIPFGQDPSGAMLSDHIGYVATFRLKARGSPGGTSAHERRLFDPDVNRSKDKGRGV